MFDFPKQVTIRVPNHNDSVRLIEFLNSETEVTWGSGDRPSADKHHRDYISPSAKTAVRIYDGKLMWRGNIDLYTSDPKYMGDPEWHLLSVDEFISKITGIPDPKVELEIGDLI